MDHRGALAAVYVFLFVVVVLACLTRRRRDGKRRSEPPGESSRAEPWPRAFLPLVVAASPEALIMAREIQRAMSWWNRQTGLELFFPVVLDLQREDADKAKLVYISMTLAGLKPRLAVAVEDTELERRTPVSLPPVADAGVLERIIARELGHVLGLKRDDKPDSVMCEDLTADYSYGVKDADRYLLGQWYG